MSSSTLRVTASESTRLPAHTATMLETMRGRQLHGLHAVGGGADHLDPGIAAEPPRQAAASERVVVGDEHAHPGACAVGNGNSHVERPAGADRRRCGIVARSRTGVEGHPAPAEPLPSRAACSQR